MEENKVVVITQCMYTCPFWECVSHEMSCGHPYWDDKPAYSDRIITQENGRDGNIPPKCPLLKGSLSIVYKLKEK